VTSFVAGFVIKAASLMSYAFYKTSSLYCFEKRYTLEETDLTAAVPAPSLAPAHQGPRTKSHRRHALSGLRRELCLRSDHVLLLLTAERNRSMSLCILP
jgi:hypothetical protein